MASSPQEAEPLPEGTKPSPCPHHTLPASPVTPAVKESLGRGRRKGKRDQCLGVSLQGELACSGANQEAPRRIWSWTRQKLSAKRKKRHF